MAIVYGYLTIRGRVLVILLYFFILWRFNRRWKIDSTFLWYTYLSLLKYLELYRFLVYKAMIFFKTMRK